MSKTPAPPRHGRRKIKTSSRRPLGKIFQPDAVDVRLRQDEPRTMLKIFPAVFRALFLPAKARASGADAAEETRELAAVLTAASDAEALEAAARVLNIALVPLLPRTRPGGEKIQERILPSASRLVESVKILDKVKKKRQI